MISTQEISLGRRREDNRAKGAFIDGEEEEREIKGWKQNVDVKDYKRLMEASPKGSRREEETVGLIRLL